MQYEQIVISYGSAKEILYTLECYDTDWGFSLDSCVIIASALLFCCVFCVGETKTTTKFKSCCHITVVLRFLKESLLATSWECFVNSFWTNITATKDHNLSSRSSKIFSFMSFVLVYVCGISLSPLQSTPNTNDEKQSQLNILLFMYLNAIHIYVYTAQLC